MELTKEEVKHVADLARLEVKDDEYERYGQQLYDILSEVDKILSVDIEGEQEIMISPCKNINCYKSDVVGKMLSRDDIFKNVKHHNGDYILVPKVICD